MSGGVSTMARVPFLGVTAGDRVGCSAAILEPWAVVGACQAESSDGSLQLAGKVFSFKVSSNETAAAEGGSNATTANAWEDTSSHGIILPPVATAGAKFGTAIALTVFNSIGIMVVGSSGEFFERGAAHVFQFTPDASQPSLGSQWLRKLVPVDAVMEDHFGSAVALFEDRAVISARGADYYPAGLATIEGGGAVYVFDVLAGTQLAKLYPSNPLDGTPLLSCYWFGAALAFQKNLIVIGAPRAKPPCAAGTLSGAVFTFTSPDYNGNDIGSSSSNSAGTSALTARELGYNQTGKFTAPESDDGLSELNVEFGAALGLLPFVTSSSSSSSSSSDGDGWSALVVGAPGAANGRGAVYMLGPFNASAPYHDGLSLPTAYAPRVVAPTSLGGQARMGTALSVDPASGLALISAPEGWTSHGYSGAVLRSRVLLSTTFGNPYNTTTSSLSMPILGALAPPPPPSSSSPASSSSSSSSSPLADVSERLLWGPDADPGDLFGTAVAISAQGNSVVGAPSHGVRGNDGLPMMLSGAAYAYGPYDVVWVGPPGAPPTPSIPPIMNPPQPPSIPPPNGPPPPVADVALIASSIVAGVIMLCLLICLLLMRFNASFLPRIMPKNTVANARRAAKRRREASRRRRLAKLPASVKLVFKLSGGKSIAEQFQAIVEAHQAKMKPADLFRAIDEDGSGTVSRKEFRKAIADLGYKAPELVLNEAFDDFDDNGNGEIDLDEFVIALGKAKVKMERERAFAAAASSTNATTATTTAMVTTVAARAKGGGAGSGGTNDSSPMQVEDLEVADTLMSTPLPPASRVVSFSPHLATSATAVRALGALGAQRSPEQKAAQAAKLQEVRERQMEVKRAMDRLASELQNQEAELEMVQKDNQLFEAARQKAKSAKSCISACSAFAATAGGGGGGAARKPAMLVAGGSSLSAAAAGGGGGAAAAAGILIRGEDAGEEAASNTTPSREKEDLLEEEEWVSVPPSPPKRTPLASRIHEPLATRLGLLPEGDGDGVDDDDGIDDVEKGVVDDLGEEVLGEAE